MRQGYFKVIYYVLKKVSGRATKKCCNTVLVPLYHSATYRRTTCEDDKYEDYSVSKPKRKSNGQLDGVIECHSEKLSGSPGGNEGQGNCRGRDNWAGTHTEWCRNNCRSGYCPQNYCICD